MTPEKAHYFSMGAFDLLLRIPVISGVIKASLKTRSNPFELAGLTFPNRLGMAAGFDKNARFLHALKAMGFGFVEIGTVTPLPQDGNPKPRIFRLPKDEALINRMGFNNDGLEVVAKRLEKRPANLIVAGNIGKNKVTPNEAAVNDYRKCFERLFDLVDFFVINISSPNTPGLRELQAKEPLKKLIAEIDQLNQGKENSKAIFLKIAPDISDEEMVDIVDVINESSLNGIVINNTTISRAELISSKEEVEKIGNGGVSGAPLTQKSAELQLKVRDRLNQDKHIIASGGIMNGSDAKRRLDDGAELVEIYTGLIYGGPGFVPEVIKAIS